MNNFFALTTTSIFFIASGWNLSFLITKAQIIERLGLSFLLGGGLTTFLWFGISLLGLSINLTTLVLTGVLLWIVGYVVTRSRKLKMDSLSTQAWSQQEKAIAILTILLLVIAFSIGVYTPLTAWDSIALYDFRGHAIAIEHSLNFSKLGSYFMSYPLMVSLSHAIVYMLGGNSAQGLHAIIFTAFVMVVYGRLKAWTDNKYALVGTLLLITQSELFSHATFAYTNLPYTSYLVLGFLYVVMGDAGSLLIGGILLGLSTWVRSAEVFWIIGILLIIWQGLRLKAKYVSVVAIFYVLFFKFSWSLYLTQIFSVVGQVADSNLTHFSLTTITKIINNLWDIAKYLYWNIYLPYIGMWFLTIPSIVVSLIKKNIKLFMLVSTIIGSATMVIVGVMIFSTYFETWNQIGDSAKRMMLFVIPLSIINSVYALYVINKKHE